MSDVINCDPCAYEDNITYAQKWCTTCEEGYCADCEKVHRSLKMSRNHNLITMSDYRKNKNVSVSQTCEEHNKRYDLYCSLHDIALCIDCVDQHKTCSKLLSLDKAVENSKQSTALADLEDKINGALHNVIKFLKEEKLNEEQFETHENLIKKNIKETRNNLNTHLDFLENQMIINLTEQTTASKATHCSNLDQWFLVDQKQKIETMKKMASDARVFLGTREINKMVSAEIKFIKTKMTDAKHFGITMTIDPTITSLLDCTNLFGTISVIERKSELQFKDPKLDQAQSHISDPAKGSKSVIGLQLKHKFKLKKERRSSILSCLILPNGHMLIVNTHGKGCIMEFNDQGQYLRNIPCSDNPFYITRIDSDSFAATHISSRNISIINLYSPDVIKIPVEHDCRGISYQDGKLYVVLTGGKGIVVLDLSGKVLNRIKYDTGNTWVIETTKNRIYTNGLDVIECFSLTGKGIWWHYENNMKGPAGIAVYNENEVFVACKNSYNLLTIKQFGQKGKSKCFLSLRDGLEMPRAIYYDRDRKELLVCNEYDGIAAMYTVIDGQIPIVG
ncbi:Hypothetical predicted protein [Mytilus galloprovincialis]|uniref:B box-type domain-containing protein n=1 Tax=Mytilus galloprovincialis TaxID=29158 RepID=A0A8B6EMK0_MYTGA|nr:Hypothetical predicted protein [Mytilus galloprovincialis]